MNFYKKHPAMVFVLLVVIIVLVTIFSLTVGQIDVSVKTVLAIVMQKLGLPFFQDTEVTAEQLAVVWYIRMPRTLIGLMVGSGLAAAGTVMQGIFSNPLADPSVIGVSSGAAVGAVWAISLGVSSMYMLPAFAFVGAMVAVAITVGLAMRHGKIPVMTLLLSGVVVGMLLSAVTSGILTVLSSQKIHQYLFWTIGGLDYRRWEHVFMGFGPILLGIGLMLLLARHLNILALGEVEAKAVGMPVQKYRILLLIIAAMTTATGVCVSGNIGFVGLVVPHMMRLVVGPDHRVLLPASILLGGVFLVFCDTVGRVIASPLEIRVGIMTAFLGTPYFLYLLRKSNNKMN